MMLVTRINEFKAAEGKSEELFEFLRAMVTYVSASEGAVLCEALQRHDDHSSFVVIEKWTSIDFHKKFVKNFPKEEMVVAMSLVASPPKGGYFNG